MATDNPLTPQQVKECVPHTWPLFFARYGRFTPIQQQAIPPIGNGRDTLVIAPTAAGKTEAVIAPLLERHWWAGQQHGLSVLYICPTRALVRDLYERLQPALMDTGISLGMKTGDVAMPVQMPAILLTTPESTDSLLTRHPKLFIPVQAVVLDEIHLFDNTPRGDQVRCLLPRIERIRQYARPDVLPTQRVALSATVPDPEGVARRYLHDAAIVHVPGSREIVAEIRPFYDPSDLVTPLARRAVPKSLIFCNAREEVEETAVYLRQHLPYHADIFVHYSNLDAAMRREVEDQFAAAAVGICVCTSTLELGIDIGSVDDVVLLGAPPNLTSFLQRIGRGGRREARTRVLCLPKSPAEWARFEALLTLANDESLLSPVAGGRQPARLASFRPATLVQQIFSLIKQSPTGSVRLADVRLIAPAEVTSEDIRKIVSHLTWDGYLQTGRLGEWKPDEKLQVLLDQHEIYTNIGAMVLGVTAVDAHTGRTIAQTERSYPQGTVLLFGGKTMVVVWQEKYRFGLASVTGKEADDILRFRKSYAAIPFLVVQTVARSLEIPTNQMVVLPQEPGMWLFHFWGTVWGELLTAVLQANRISAEFVNEYCLYVRRPITQLPPWNSSLVDKAARDIIATLANRLQMGRFHRLLPANIAVAATIGQLNLERFSQVYQATTISQLPQIYEQLHQLAQ